MKKNHLYIDVQGEVLPTPRSKLHRQIVCGQIGSSCGPPVKDSFLCYYERDFMLSIIIMRHIVLASTYLSKTLLSNIKISDHYIGQVICIFKL